MAEAIGGAIAAAAAAATASQSSRGAGLAERATTDGTLRSLLSYLFPSARFRVGCTCRTDWEGVSPLFRERMRVARAPGSTLVSLLRAGESWAAALRLRRLSGIDPEALSMPLLVEAAYAWAHYGRPSGGRRPFRRVDHLARLTEEFPQTKEGEAVRGIQATMRSELAAVQAVVELGLLLNRKLAEVGMLKLVPEDTPGKLEGRLGVTTVRQRGKTEATALMWSTRYGVRWVEMLLRLGADPAQATPAGWTALLYGATFQARGIVSDGSTDSGDQYGGYRRRPRGVIGPLLDAGAVPSSTLPLKLFQEVFAPSPVIDTFVGPVEVARSEPATDAAWAQELLGTRSGSR